MKLSGFHSLTKGLEGRRSLKGELIHSVCDFEFDRSSSLSEGNTCLANRRRTESSLARCPLHPHTALLWSASAALASCSFSCRVMSVLNSFVVALISASAEGRRKRVYSLLGRGEPSEGGPWTSEARDGRSSDVCLTETIGKVSMRGDGEGVDE